MGGDGVNLVNGTTGDVVSCECWMDSIASNLDIMRVAHYLSWYKGDVLYSQSDSGYYFNHSVNDAGDKVSYVYVSDFKTAEDYLTHRLTSNAVGSDNAAAAAANTSTTVAYIKTPGRCNRSVCCDYFDHTNNGDNRRYYDFYKPDVVTVSQTVNGVRYTTYETWNAKFDHFPNWAKMGNSLICSTCLEQTGQTKDMIILSDVIKVHRLGRVVKDTEQRSLSLIFTALDYLLHNQTSQSGNKQLRPQLKKFVVKYGGQADTPLYLGLLEAINNWLGGASIKSTTDWLMSE